MRAFLHFQGQGGGGGGGGGANGGRRSAHPSLSASRVKAEQEITPASAAAPLHTLQGHMCTYTHFHYLYNVGGERGVLRKRLLSDSLSVLHLLS